MRYINELREGENVAEVYYCKAVQNMKSKAGKAYIAVSLQDKTGVLDGKVWDINSGIEHFEARDYVYVEGQITVFQGTNQLNIRRVRRCGEGEYDPSEYMPCTKKNIDEMYEELKGYIGLVKNEYLHKLLSLFFLENGEFIRQFREHSAAKTVHHAFIGGLLEHTLAVTRICNTMADNYEMINRDLLLTAAMFHDMGKILEIEAFPVNDYTDEGQLLGHIYMGTELISAWSRQIPNFPKSLAVELKHCILAHHGELEFGSPKKPALLEAIVLAHADNMDAKVQTMIEALEAGDEKSEWLGFNKFLGTNIRRTKGELSGK